MAVGDTNYTNPRDENILFITKARVCFLEPDQTEALLTWITSLSQL